MRDGAPRRRWECLGWTVRVAVPGGAQTRNASVRLAALTRPASFAARAIPPVLVVLGLALALLSATVLDDLVSEGVATLGVGAGAALWFGGGSR